MHKAAPSLPAAQRGRYPTPVADPPPSSLTRRPTPSPGEASANGHHPGPSSPEPTTRRAPTSHGESPRACILVVPHDEPDRAVLRERLERLGLALVAEVADSESGARLAHALHPAALILHWRALSPTAAPAVRSLHAQRVAPVLLYGTGPDSTHLGLALEADIAACLPSSCPENDFSACFEFALARWGKWLALGAELDKTKHRLRARTLIERAKGVLMRDQGFTEEQAYVHIRVTSQKKRKPMLEVAQAILLADEARRN